MKTLEVNTDPGYRVHIGEGAYKLFASDYRSTLDSADRIAVIADRKAASLHSEKLLQELKGLPVHVFEIPMGEKAKSAETFMSIHTFLLEIGCSRRSVLIAFGGGATGDVAGFAASTFMRGIPFFQCPTTILAHDSAVGGKTAINHPAGKNMIGTFYQPQAVLYDVATLSTLPLHEVRSGMAEVIKHAFISNEEWLSALLTIRNFEAMTPEELTAHLEKGIAVKAAIVEEDEFESGVRKFLNFGHTLAHAIEADAGYGTITHGEAVALGMAFDLLLSRHPLTDSFLTWCYANDYPLTALADRPFSQLLPYMKKDKKTSEGQLVFIELKKTGEPSVRNISEQEAESIYTELQKKVLEVLA